MKEAIFIGNTDCQRLSSPTIPNKAYGYVITYEYETHMWSHMSMKLMCNHMWVWLWVISHFCESYPISVSHIPFFTFISVCVSVCLCLCGHRTRHTDMCIWRIYHSRKSHHILLHASACVCVYVRVCVCVVPKQGARVLSPNAHRSDTIQIACLLKIIGLFCRTVKIICLFCRTAL